MRLIDADEFFRNYPELAIEPYINAPTVELQMGRMTNGVIIPIERPYVIDNCDMNVFDPEKYMRGKEE